MLETKNSNREFWGVDEPGLALSEMTDTDLDYLVSYTKPNLKGKEDGNE